MGMDTGMTAWDMIGLMITSTRRIPTRLIQSVCVVHGRVDMKVAGTMSIVRSGSLREWAAIMGM